MKYAAKKLAALLATMLAVSFVTFAAFQVVAGDPATDRLGTEATPELVSSLDPYAVIVAVGAEPTTPPIPGADGCWNVMNVFGNADKLGKNVVVIGGSESGVETAFYLCENGHDVTILTRQDRLAPDATPIHYHEIMQEKWEGMENFHVITGASTTAVEPGRVVYRVGEEE